MSLVVLRVAKRGRALSRLPDSFWDRAPSDAKPEVRTWRRSDSELTVAAFGAAIEANVVETHERLILVHGPHTADTLRRLDEELQTTGVHSRPEHIPECVFAILMQEHSSTVFAGHHGTDQLLHVETDSEFVWTNHPTLIGHWVKDSAPISTKALASMLHTYYIADYAHYIESITRTVPGTKYFVTPTAVTAIPAKQGHDFSPISDDELLEGIENVGEATRSYLASQGAAVSLGLSGGKDSRALLALIGAENLQNRLRLTTYGEAYAPDVMAASAVAAEARLSGSHTIARPPLVPVIQDHVAAITDDLLVDITGSSLADRRSLGRQKSLHIGGHQFGLKDPETYPDRDSYIRSRLDAVSVSQLLSMDARQDMRVTFEEQLLEALADAPDSKLAMIERFHLRGPHFTVGSTVAGHATNSQFHPLLDYRVRALEFRAHPSYTQNQIFHYLFLRQGTHALEAVGFADDSWPQRTEEIARNLGFPFRGSPGKPYPFNQAFPSQSSFGRYNWRIDLFSRMRDSVTQYFTDTSRDLDIVDTTAVMDLVNRDPESWNFTNLYQLGALLKVMLVRELGTKLLSAQNRPSIERFVGDVLRGPAIRKTNQDSDRLSAMTEALEKSERSIRDIALQLRDQQSDNQINPSALLEAFRADRSAMTLHNSTYARALDLGPFHDLASGPINLSRVSDSEGTVTLSGSLLRGESDRVLVGVKDVPADADVANLVWSPSGFWYRYLSQDSLTGAFELEFTIPQARNTRLEMFIRHWAGEPCFVSIH